MKKRFRLTLLAGAALGLSIAAVATAGQARQTLDRQARQRRCTDRDCRLHGSAPELAVQQASYKLGAASNPGFVMFSDPTNDATAKITIFSPPGYTNNLTQAPGATVGKAYAIVNAVIAGVPILLPLSGPVVVGNPTDPSLVAAYAQCKGPTDPPTPQETLVLNTSFQGQTISVPDFLNTITIGGSTYVTQEICLLPPSQAPFNAQLVAGRLHRQRRLDERRERGPVPVDRRLHALQRQHAEPGRDGRGADVRRAPVLVHAEAAEEPSRRSSSSRASSRSAVSARPRSR